MSRFEELGPLEEALRQALQREEPPLGFEARVLGKLDEQALAPSWRERLGAWLNPLPQRRAAWAAALCLLIVSGVVVERERERRIEGEAAKEKLLLALRVTGSQLRAVHEQVREATEDSTIAP